LTPSQSVQTRGPKDVGTTDFTSSGQHVRASPPHTTSGAGEGNNVGEKVAEEEVVRWVGALGSRRPRCHQAGYEQYPRVVRGVGTCLVLQVAREKTCRSDKLSYG
jgi:hypothetical protein